MFQHKCFLIAASAPKKILPISNEGRFLKILLFVAMFAAQNAQTLKLHDQNYSNHPLSKIPLTRVFLGGRAKKLAPKINALVHEQSDCVRRSRKNRNVRLSHMYGLFC